MAPLSAQDFLAKQLQINSNIVTFRSLSRELGVHVDVARTELEAFRTSTPSICATYVIVGENQTAGRRTHNMEIDFDSDDDLDDDEYDKSEDEPETEVILVSAEELEAVKQTFTRVLSTQIYALSPAPITDAGLLCTPTASLREIDAKKGPVEKDNAKRVEWMNTVGEITGSHVQTRPVKLPATVASSSKVTLPSKVAPALLKTTSADKQSTDKDKTSAKAGVSSKGKEKANEEEDSVKPKPVEKAKPTGKLDWSNAKSKETKAVETKAAKTKAAEAKAARANIAEAKRENDKAAEAKAKAAAKEEKAQKPTAPRIKTESKEEKRGTKRKPTTALLSESDSEEPPPKPQPKSAPSNKSTAASSSKSRAKKAVLSSDEEEEEVAPRKRLQKGRKVKQEDVTEVDSEVERSLRAMMDIDDEVIPARTNAPPTSEEDIDMASDPEADEEEEEDKQEDSEDDMISKPQPKKRKPKKVWPVGRNGIKKKRTVKAEMKMDEKGYMVTEDHSSYESVSESEEPAAEEEKPVKVVKAKAEKKATAKKPEKAKQKKEETPAEAEAAPKPKPPATTTNGKQKGKPIAVRGGIQNFFSKKPE